MPDTRRQRPVRNDGERHRQATPRHHQTRTMLEVWMAGQHMNGRTAFSDAADAIPGDLDTAGWSWGELADYQGAWEQGFYARLTELCRNVIEQVNA